MNVDVCDRRLNFICEKGLFEPGRNSKLIFFSLVVDRCSSLNDICGRHGRCVNTDDGQIRCQCHFLFGGNHCRSCKTTNNSMI